MGDVCIETVGTLRSARGTYRESESDDETGGVWTDERSERHAAGTSSTEHSEVDGQRRRPEHDRRQANAHEDAALGAEIGGDGELAVCRGHHSCSTLCEAHSANARQANACRACEDPCQSEAAERSMLGLLTGRQPCRSGIVPVWQGRPRNERQEDYVDAGRHGVTFTIQRWSSVWPTAMISRAAFTAQP